MESITSLITFAIIVPQALFIILFALVCILDGLLEKKGRHLVPSHIPIIKSTIPFVFNGYEFLKNTKQNATGSTIRIGILGGDIYLVKGPKAAAEVFQNARLTVTRAYSLVLKQCFGMQQTSVDAYLHDTSGSRQKPIPGSTHLTPADRIGFLTHENFVPGLLKEGLGPAFDQFQQRLTESLHKLELSGDAWLEGNDFSDFFETHHASSLIRALFGDTLVDDNPDFVSNLWVLDRNIMRLAQRWPRFLIPRAFKIRDKLVGEIQAWHSKAVNSADDSVWGLPMMKQRYSTLLTATGQDKSSVASTDLALIWAAITNVVPSSMTMALHVFRDPSILTSLRASLDYHQSANGQGHAPSAEDLESIPLLASLYAETLRFGVQIHVPRSAPYHSLSIGGVRIPKDRLIVVNTWLAHHDETIWDTHGGTMPLNRFCAGRFLVDADDPTSGPARKKFPLEKKTVAGGVGAVSFSTEGLEGAWIPFGGGQHACPGRLLAKRIMLFSTAFLVSNFDIDIFAGDKALAFGAPRFGFGVARPPGPVKFRIRLRQ